MKKFTSTLRRLPLLLLAAGLFVAAAPASRAAVLNFPGLFLPSTAPTAPLTTSTTSTLGTLSNAAVLSFTLTTTGATYLSDINVTITVPSGASILYAHPLPGAANGPGTYTGAVTFPTGTTPGNGTYSLTFQNTFATGLDVTLSNISLTVTPLAVPEPGTWALAIGGAGIVGVGVLRQRRARA